MEYQNIVNINRKTFSALRKNDKYKEEINTWSAKVASFGQLASNVVGFCDRKDTRSELRRDHDLDVRATATYYCSEEILVEQLTRQMCVIVDLQGLEPLLPNLPNGGAASEVLRELGQPELADAIEEGLVNRLLKYA